jgi:hypothetical protein
MTKVYKNMVGRSQRKRTRGRPRGRWSDNIRMGVREIVWESCGLDSYVSG